MTNTKIERCKKCYNRNIEIGKEQAKKQIYYYAICSNERCGLHTINFPTKEEAIKNWNHWNNPSNIKKTEKKE